MGLPRGREQIFGRGLGQAAGTAFEPGFTVCGIHNKFGSTKSPPQLIFYVSLTEHGKFPSSR